jgi:hypothetical protein
MALGKLALLHQAVDVCALEAGLGFDLGAAQDAMFGRHCRHGWDKGLRRHAGHSSTLSWSLCQKVPRIE